MTSAPAETTPTDSLETILRLSNERMAATPVEGGALRMTISRLTRDSLCIEAPVPTLDGYTDPIGVQALLAALADTGAGLAAAMGTAFGDGGATIEFRMDHAAPLEPDARALSVQGRRLQIVGGAALAEAVVTDDRGRVVVRGHGHFARSFDGPAADVELPPAAVAGSRLADLCSALSLPEATDPADREVPLPAVLANSRGQIHGGMVLTLAERLQREIRGTGARLLSMHVDYLRPAACDGSPARCRSEYVRRGRRFATLRTELTRADGRPAAIATGLWSTHP